MGRNIRGGESFVPQFHKGYYIKQCYECGEEFLISKEMESVYNTCGGKNCGKEKQGVK